MGVPSSDTPDIQFPAEPWSPLEPIYVPPVMPPRREPRARYVVLFLLTLATATLTGAEHYASFITQLGAVDLRLSLPALLLRGLWYSVGVLAILGAHEFGHYFACRYYRVDASLPYFIPLWIPLIPTPGTLGAVIRIRQRIPTKRQVFDIGIAGPLAGFVVLVPVLFVGLSLSEVVTLPQDFEGIEFGEPLIFQLAGWLFFGTLPEGQTVNLHPMGWAAWFGLLATALNLAPIGQLDGGHISYAVFGRKSSRITLLTTMAALALLILSGGAGYLLWTVLLIVMLFILGPHHPPVVDEDEPLDRTRHWLALSAAVIFVLSFTPVPVSIIGFDEPLQDADGIDVHRDAPPDFRHRGQNLFQRGSHLDAPAPLEEELHAVLAAQPLERRGRGAEDREAAAGCQGLEPTDEVCRNAHGFLERPAPNDGVDERHQRRIAHPPPEGDFLLEERGIVLPARQLNAVVFRVERLHDRLPWPLTAAGAASDLRQ
jgi:hypothetical protein